ncbi:MAG: hypothetical protein HY814_12185 [Candidatus Riflebacteria bacterium]|nr:hypothetical protein [Candidatus Riflebacteria bacterium]
MSRKWQQPVRSSPRFGRFTDTPPAVEARRVDLLRGMSASERFALALDASARLRDAAMAGLRLRHPEAGPEELARLYLERVVSSAASPGRKPGVEPTPRSLAQK